MNLINKIILLSSFTVCYCAFGEMNLESDAYKARLVRFVDLIKQPDTEKEKILSTLTDLQRAHIVVTLFALSQIVADSDILEGTVINRIVEYGKAINNAEISKSAELLKMYGIDSFTKDITSTLKETLENFPKRRFVSVMWEHIIQLANYTTTNLHKTLEAHSQTK